MHRRSLLTDLNDKELHPGVNAHDYPADSIDDAHIILLPHADSNVALALACVARHEEIYSVMFSALMQRRVFGIMDPLLGLALEPLSWTVRVVFGWISEGDEADDVRSNSPRLVLVLTFFRSLRYASHTLPPTQARKTTKWESLTLRTIVLLQRSPDFWPCRRNFMGEWWRPRERRSRFPVKW